MLVFVVVFVSGVGCFLFVFEQVTVQCHMLCFPFDVIFFSSSERNFLSGCCSV